jgi:hypothetical protein
LSLKGIRDRRAVYQKGRRAVYQGKGGLPKSGGLVAETRPV